MGDTIKAKILPPPVMKAKLTGLTVTAARLTPLTVTPSAQSQHIEPPSGKDGFSEIDVEAVTMQEKSITASKSRQIVEADEGYSGLSKVTVGGYVPDTETKTVNITENGQTLVAKSVAKDGMTVVEVNTDVHPTIEDDTLVFALANASVKGDTITV